MNYKTYWEGRSDPEWESGDPAHYRLLGEELRILIGLGTASRVLELGCGNGALFRYLGVAPEAYKGVDISPAMIGAFRSKRADLELVCADASTYLDEEQWDLILINGMLQYFNQEMLRSLFTNIAAMMKSESRTICANIPWKALRVRYTLGLAHGYFRGGRFVKACKTIAMGPGFGRWFSRREIARLAKQARMRAEFYGGMVYSYRFHVVLFPAK